MLGGWTEARRRADRARLRLPRLGAARRRRERQGRALRRRQRRRRARAGTRSTPARSSAGSGGERSPEPFCLVVSLVNPHDVLGYPASYEAGGYAGADFRDLGVELPPTLDENLAAKPAVHSLMRMGMNAYMGPLRNRARAARLRQLLRPPAPRRRREDRPHRRRPRRPRRARTRCARGRSSSAAPTTARWASPTAACARRCSTSTRRRSTSRSSSPTRCSSREPAETDALASLVDVVPTLLGLAGDRSPTGLRGRDLAPVLADAAEPERERVAASPVDLDRVLEHPARRPRSRTRSTSPTTTTRPAPRCRRRPASPTGSARSGPRPASTRLLRPERPGQPSEYEMYDLERDPDEVDNLLDVRTGEAPRAVDVPRHHELRERLTVAMAEAGTA